MKTSSRTSVGQERFDSLPEDYAGLCRRYIPRPLRDATDYAAACQAIEPLMGFEDRLNADQVDYLEAVSSFIETYDRARDASMVLVISRPANIPPLQLSPMSWLASLR